MASIETPRKTGMRMSIFIRFLGFCSWVKRALGPRRREDIKALFRRRGRVDARGLAGSASFATCPLLDRNIEYPKGQVVMFS